MAMPRMVKNIHSSFLVGAVKDPPFALATTTSFQKSEKFIFLTVFPWKYLRSHCLRLSTKRGVGGLRGQKL
jgi:hypothetical protein